jgi:hypothetical protein
MKIILSEEFRRMQKLAGIISEIRFTNPDKIDPETKIAKELANISGDYLSQYEFTSYIRDYYNNPDEYDIDTDSEYFQAIEYAYENPQEGWDLYSSQFEDSLDEIQFSQGDKPKSAIKFLKTIYYFDQFGLGTMRDMPENYPGEPEPVYGAGDVLEYEQGSKNTLYNAVINSDYLVKNKDYALIG